MPKVSKSRPWSFDAEPTLFKLVAEAKRISLAYLFDPYVATYSSDVELLPHQIEAVYDEMLTKLPLRFLLADDPGAGKTIMAGLFIKELIVRGDLDRCLVVVPGGLAEQWQDEWSTTTCHGIRTALNSASSAFIASGKRRFVDFGTWSRQALGKGKYLSA